MRACIGRAFAWQEALLVAILLQRFDFRLDNPAYDLNIPFNLTIKPKDLLIRATLRHGMNVTDLEMAINTGRAAKRVHGECQLPKAAPSGSPMHILFGSNTGTCHALAQRLAADAQGRGFNATADPLDLASQALPRSDPIVIICSSFDGEPQDNARRFIEAIQSGPKGNYDNMNYAVFGCGHRTFSICCFEGRFNELKGSRRLGQHVPTDPQSHLGNTEIIWRSRDCRAWCL